MPIDPILNDLPEQSRRFRTEEQSNDNGGRTTEPPPLGLSAQKLLKRDELRLTKKPPANPFETLIRFRQRKQRRRQGQTDDRI